jgi:hypothetical protein
MLQSTNKKMNTSTLTTNSNLVNPDPTVFSPPETHPSGRRIIYHNLTRQAFHYGVRANVLLDQRVLDDFCELDASLGDDTAGVILALLAFEAAAQATGDGRLSVCLRRRDGQAVEVDLMVSPRQLPGGNCLYLQWTGTRDLAVAG